MTSKKVLPINITTKSKITLTVLGSKLTLKKRENLPKKAKETIDRMRSGTKNDL